MTIIKNILKSILNFLKRIMNMIAWSINKFGVVLIVRARSLAEVCNSTIPKELRNHQLLALHKKISNHLKEFRKEYHHYKYYSYYPYQEFSTLNIIGARNTEERFDCYGLANLIKSNDTILDIGCDCGFLALYTAYRTGCKAEGFDTNPYMINIGNDCANFLNLTDQVNLTKCSFQDFKTAKQYSAIFSFAVHWTSDQRHRPDFDAYMQRMYELLVDGGLLFFESHGFEVGSKDFHERMQKQKHLFSWECSKVLENGMREFFIGRKI